MLADAFQIFETADEISSKSFYRIQKDDKAERKKTAELQKRFSLWTAQCWAAFTDKSVLMQ